MKMFGRRRLKQPSWGTQWGATSRTETAGAARCGAACVALRAATRIAGHHSAVGGVAVSSTRLASAAATLMSPNSGRVANEEPAERRLQQQCSFRPGDKVIPERPKQLAIFRPFITSTTRMSRCCCTTACATCATGGSILSWLETRERATNLPRCREK